MREGGRDGGRERAESVGQDDEVGSGGGFGTSRTTWREGWEGVKEGAKVSEWMEREEGTEEGGAEPV